MIVNELLDRPHAQTLWDYNHVKQPLKPADFLFVLCGYNLEVADYVDIIFMQKMGKKIVLSGGSKDTQGMARRPWKKKESHIFLERLMELGGKKENIIVEDDSMTPIESFQKSKEMLKDHDPELTSGLIVTTPHMERRAYSLAQVQWPEITWEVTSPNITYDDYADKFDEEALIELLVGDTWRIKEYAKKGLQAPQDMPEDVEKSLKTLIDKGYTKHIDS